MIVYTLEIWNRLMESRIKLQKLLVVANKLPQTTSWDVVKEMGGTELNESLKQGILLSFWYFSNIVPCSTPNLHLNQSKKIF